LRLAVLAAAFLPGFQTRALAQTVGVHVNVSGNVSGALATSIKEADGLVAVTPGPADTQITFTIAIDSPYTLSSHSSAIVTDTGEIDFAGSADLTGLGFVSGFDGDPGSGSSAIVLSEFGSAPGATDLFRVTYDLAALASDGSEDWTLFVTGVNIPPGENIVAQNADEAFIRVDGPASGVPTLSGPGAAALALMLAVAGVFVSRRRVRQAPRPPGSRGAAQRRGGPRSARPQRRIAPGF